MSLVLEKCKMRGLNLQSCFQQSFSVQSMKHVTPIIGLTASVLLVQHYLLLHHNLKTFTIPTYQNYSNGFVKFHTFHKKIHKALKFTLNSQKLNFKMT